MDVLRKICCVCDSLRLCQHSTTKKKRLCVLANQKTLRQLSSSDLGLGLYVCLNYNTWGTLWKLFIIAKNNSWCFLFPLNLNYVTLFYSLAILLHYATSFQVFCLHWARNCHATGYSQSENTWCFGPIRFHSGWGYLGECHKKITVPSHFFNRLGFSGT